jgi:hypothetical protein
MLQVTGVSVAGGHPGDRIGHKILQRLVAGGRRRTYHLCAQLIDEPRCAV